MVRMANVHLRMTPTSLYHLFHSLRNLGGSLDSGTCNFISIRSSYDALLLGLADGPLRHNRR
jgi:hypothetical protein